MSRAGHKYGKILMVAIGLVAIGGIDKAYADPINISTGNINFINFDGASIGLLGPNGDVLTGEIGSALFAYTPPYACMSSTGACAGQTVNLSVSDSLTSSPSGPSGFLFEGGMIVNGVKYSVDAFSYNIAAGSAVTPLTGTVTAPFTFAATTRGTSSTGLTNTFDWRGSGTATVGYGASNGWASSDYTFSTQAAPTPEPSSVLLLGSAVAGLFFARRRLLPNGLS